MKRQISKEILYRPLISKSKYEQAVQGLFTIGTSIDRRCFSKGGQKTTKALEKRQLSSLKLRQSREKVGGKRGLKSIHPICRNIGWIVLLTMRHKW